MYFRAARLFDEEVHQSSSFLMFASLEKNCCHWTLRFLFLGWKICSIKSHTFKPCAFRLSRTWSNLSYFSFLNLSSLSSLCAAQARARFLCPFALRWAARSLGSDSRTGLERIGPLEETGSRIGVRSESESVSLQPDSDAVDSPDSMSGEPVDLP